MSEEFRIDHKMELAENFEKSGKYLHAIQIYNSIIDEPVVFPEAYIQLAGLYEGLGNIEQGKKILELFITRDSESLDARIYTSQYLLKHSYWDEVCEVLDPIDPEEEPLVLFWKGLSYFNLNDFEIAKITLLKFLVLDKNLELRQHVYLLLAKIEIELNEFRAALNFAREIEFTYSESWDVKLTLAKIYFNLNMLTHAAESIDRALKINSKEKLILECAGKIYYRIGDLKKAQKCFDKLLEETDSFSAEVYTYIAALAKENEDIEKARVNYELALSLDPNYPSAIQGLKSLGINENKLDSSK